VMMILPNNATPVIVSFNICFITYFISILSMYEPYFGEPNLL
jgi:hypothetical protein